MENGTSERSLEPIRMKMKKVERVMRRKNQRQRRTMEMKRKKKARRRTTRSR